MSTSPDEHPSNEWIREAELAGSLGIARAELRRIRAERLTEGQHWIMQGREVAISRGAIDIILSAAESAPDGAKNPPPETGRGVMVPDERSEGVAGQQEAATGNSDYLPLTADAKNPPAEGVVTKIPRNNRLVIAEVDGAEARVRVRSNEHFMPGMKIRVAHEHDDVWVLVGRTPRYRGRW